MRTFIDKAVPYETIERVLDQARMAPSGSNYQPWEAVVLTGAPLRSLQERLLASEPDDPLEFDQAVPSQVEKYQARLSVVGGSMYTALGIGRDQRDERAVFTRMNMLSFGAPALLLCHFPKLMKEAQWSDVGMWLQTIMLLLRGEGLDSCPQGYMGLYSRTIKDHLGLADDTLLFCGLAMGWGDTDAAVNQFVRERVPLTEQVTFLGFNRGQAEAA